MTHVCLVTTHPFWREALGSGTSMRARYELLNRIADKVSVLFITHTDERCPLPGGTLRMQGTAQSSHIEAIKNYVRQKAVTLVYFSYDQFAGLAQMLPCRTAVEIHDVMHLRRQQFEQHGYAFPGQVNRLDEVQSLQAYDYVMSISLDEADYLRRQGVEQAIYLPPALSFERIRNHSGIRQAGLLASQAVPNLDGWRRIKRWLSQSEKPFVLAGPMAVSEDAASITRAGITNLGVLDSSSEFYTHVDVALSPVPFGAGLKIKLLEALAAGKAALATRHSIAGFPPGLESLIVVEEDLTAWNDELVEQAFASDRARIEDWYRSHFDSEQIAATLKSLL